MATGGFNPNCIVPLLSSVTVGTTAVQLKNSSTLAVKFSVTNPGSIALYLGDSAVSATVHTIKLTAGSTVTFGPDEIVGGRQKMSYDLAGFYARATAAAQAAILTLYVKGGTTTAF